MSFNIGFATPGRIEVVTDAVSLNNEGVFLMRSGKHQEALDRFKKALQIKIRCSGFVSLDTCISLSGYADAFLGLRDFDAAFREARRLLQISKSIKDRNQERIANEILSDIAKASPVKRDLQGSFEDLATITGAAYA
jgi:tetratricopeptide (TPR) repeat protein